MRRKPGAPLPLLLGLAVGALASANGCGSDCCTVDSLPIPLGRAPVGDGTAAGALLALAASPSVSDGRRFRMVIDTGSPITILNTSGGAGASLDLAHHDFDLFDASAAAPEKAALRAEFRDIGLLDLPLGPVGDAATVPLGVLGGDLLRSFSVELRFAPACAVGGPCPSITFWHRLGASQGFLEDAGYAVLRFTLYGGGEVTAQGDPDVFGSRGPLSLPATRVVLRGCAAPRAFLPTETPPLCCTSAAAVSLSTGVDLALLVATGVGPLVLGESAWNRVTGALDASPPTHTGDLYIASWPNKIDVKFWTTIPRLALVDLEAGANNDPGPCVELGRARRIEVVARQQALDLETAACVQPCDTDPLEPGKAQNSAAYLELGGSIPVAVVADAEPFLQSVRFDVRPEGPELDGVIGAGALNPARMELDYLGSTARAVFSCEPETPRETCWAAGRCPRLPDRSARHFCFGLGPHGLPATCAPSGC
jgi:hypothetical protein